MDNRVKSKLSHLVDCGVRRLPELRRHLRHFVTEDLFQGHPPPSIEDARFWPNSRTLLNAVRQMSATSRYTFTYVDISAYTAYVILNQ